MVTGMWSNFSLPSTLFLAVWGRITFFACLIRLLRPPSRGNVLVHPPTGTLEPRNTASAWPGLGQYAWLLLVQELVHEWCTSWCTYWCTNNLYYYLESYYLESSWYSIRRGFRTCTAGDAWEVVSVLYCASELYFSAISTEIRSVAPLTASQVFHILTVKCLLGIATPI